ncbi:DUF1571 domain-containing protein [Tuwongella immobilis]|uniref:Hypothetical conserved protein n=1 Tax=Tuwongella immobilis TaxID=692036 RepID=A0A6C2YHX4_9BACT|nr:DUF1571 domain-containing protein [Tuwongella immobilis]VIP00592.1 Hypothetical conserved protein OS=uncultured planctomycete GN=HGMM_F09D09C08 PE=4 SV=1 [Tuwongella immobilis]VTR96602.1 Hypothetical conserved protein OS=uncultured planctomycete GN=HGMM_F09D09C08 PE=4 SV=1 [Tuwongella immobilis]
MNRYTLLIWAILAMQLSGCSIFERWHPPRPPKVRMPADPLDRRPKPPLMPHSGDSAMQNPQGPIPSPAAPVPPPPPPLRTPSQAAQPLNSPAVAANATGNPNPIANSTENSAMGGLVLPSITAPMAVTPGFATVSNGATPGTTAAPIGTQVAPPNPSPGSPPAAALVPMSSDSTDPVPTTSAQPTPMPAVDPLQRLVTGSAAKYAATDSFECRLTRREVVRGRQTPEEVIRYRFRKQPYSIHMKWIGKEGNGREMIYVQNRYDDKLQILTADGDMPFTRAGARLAFSPDSFMVRSRSRHSVREAGIAIGLQRLQEAMINRQNGHTDAIRYLGRLNRPDATCPMEGIEIRIYPGKESLLPKGGRRLYGFDCQPGSPSELLPVLIITHDETGREVEYFRLDRLIQPVPLDDRDFDPTALWGAAK